MKKELNIDYSKLTKLYYSIGEVAQLFSVNASLIRFWEKEFELPHPKKNNKGNRMFTIKEIQTLDKIYQLVKIEGYKHDAAKEKLKARRKGSNDVKNCTDFSDQNELISRLEKIKSNLLKLKIS
ncbi:MAG: MerR family transcriptional regulator [Bacteroidota bacterium]